MPEIKRLVENYTVEDLTEAENALMEELELPFEIKGEDDGEVLAHITAAVWILERMESHEQPYDEALREFNER